MRLKYHKIKLEFFVLPIVFIIQEILFHLFVFARIDGNLIYLFVFGATLGMLCNTIVYLLKEKYQKIGIITISSCSFIILSAQLVYYRIFRTFFSISLVMETISDATEFALVGLDALCRVLPIILLLGAPILLEILFIKKDKKCEERKIHHALVNLAGGSLLFLIVLFSNTDLEKEAGNEFVIDTAIEKYGVLMASAEDVMGYLFSNTGNINVEAAGMGSSPENLVMKEQVSSIQAGQDMVSIHKNSRKVSAENVENSYEEDSSISHMERKTYEDNILAIDFAKLIENEKNKTIKSLHSYFAAKEPTKKNEYTGMFEGYNLIVITAEGFSNLAVDKEITPTLYKLVHEGFVFENFYNPIWQTSTSDGEYAVCTGLIPTQSNNMRKSAENDMPFGMGWVFSDFGYTSKAYHNHSYTYYGRNLSHPNLGYEFIAPGHGMEITKVWPESDLEMMENVVGQFIDHEPFHTYFMTVSGHLNYSFTGNSMSSKNKEYVENLNYSTQSKAYFACQKEFDLAMEYLIQALMEAGVAERTVIVICGDHYPYGLDMESINEIAGHEVEQDFELYKSNLVLWSYSMKEPIVVDKYCSSIDILPTIYNLFGIEYDSRLFNGKDIFSDTEPLVVFKNKSFITDKLMYNARTNETILLTEEPLEEGYLDNMKKTVRNEFNASASILKYDYYSYLEDNIH